MLFFWYEALPFKSEMCPRTPPVPSSAQQTVIFTLDYTNE